MWPYAWTHVGKPSHLGHMDRVAATMPSQAHGGAAQEAPDIGQWEGQDVPLVRPSSCNVKGGIPSSRRYLPTYLPCSWCRVSCCLFLMRKMFYLLKYNQSRITQARDKQVEENQDQSMKGCSVSSERCKNIHRNCNSGHIGLHIHKDS